MNILFYISTIRGGGAAKVMVNLANTFSRWGNAVTLVTNFPDSHEYNVDSRVKRINLEKEEAKTNVIKKNMLRCMGLRKILKAVKPDVQIAFMRENNFRAIAAGLFLKTRTIVSVRNDPKQEYSSFLSKILAKILYGIADGCVFQTEDAKAWFPQNVQKKSCIILNPVDEKFYKVQRSNAPAGIVTIGRLSKQKNHKLLLDAYFLACKDITDDLFIYGEGDKLEELKKYVQELGIKERVHFQGFTKEPEKVYANAKLFVLSSDYEGLPNVLMEAMSCGVPCISTDCPCGGPKMLIENGSNGLLVPVKGIIELKNAVENLCLDSILCDIVSKNAKRESEKYRNEIIAQKWETYFRLIVEQHYE